MKKTFTLPLILITLLLLISQSVFVYGVSIGVSPGKAEFRNLLRGGYAEQTLLISTNSQEPIGARLEIGGEINQWMRLEPANTTFTLSSTNPYELRVIVEPPLDTRSEDYSGKISVITEQIGDIQGRAGGFVKAGVLILVSAAISDEEIRSCTAGGFKINDLETGFPIDVGVTIHNQGNVRLAPEVDVTIWDQNREQTVFSDSFTTKELLPTTKERVSNEFTHSLPIGQYWGQIETDECGSGDILTFSIVEKGGIIDKAILERIINPVWSFVDDIVEIRGVFSNIGPRTVSAIFKGTITLDGKIVHTFETEELDVDSGETTDLITFFTPEKPGRYIVSGKVHYNRKQTFEKSNIINVNPKEKGTLNLTIIPLIIYLIILFTILFLLRKIMKQRKKKKHH